MEIILLLLLFGGFWAQKVSTNSSGMVAMLETFAPVGNVSDILEASNPATWSPVENASTTDQSSTPPPSVSFMAKEKVTPLGTSVDAHTVSTAFEPTISQDISTNDSSMFSEFSSAISDAAVSIISSPLGGYTGPSETTGSSLETLNGTSGLSVALTTSSLETLNGSGKLPVALTASSLETLNGTGGLPVALTASSLETLNGTGGLPVALTTSSLETLNGTGGLPVALTASSLETLNGTGGLPVALTASSLETLNGTGGLPVALTTSSLETLNGTSGLSVALTTSSLETLNGSGKLPVALTTTSLETLNGTSGLPVALTTSSQETLNGTGELPVTLTTGIAVTKTTHFLETSSIKTSTVVTSETFTNATTNYSSHSAQRRTNTWLIAALVALLVLVTFMGLLLLWRWRQKQRTGILALNKGGKHNKGVDAWAGPAQVPDEEAVTGTVGESGSDKGSGVRHGQGSGQQPTLTTFFGRKKSCQDSLAMEELEAGLAPSTKEEEPLISSVDGVVETPATDGPDVRDGNAS